MARTTVTTNDLLDALREFGKAAPKRPAGEGWVTIGELAEQEQETPATIRHRMKIARSRGVVFEQRFGTVEKDGRAIRATFYRLRNGKP